MFYESLDQEKSQQQTSVGFFWAKDNRSQYLLYEEGLLDFVGFMASCKETLTASLAGTQLLEDPASSRFIFLHEISLKGKIRGLSI